MNRVTPSTPLKEILTLFERDGYVLMEDALSVEQVSKIRASYDRQIEMSGSAHGAKRIEIKRILERGDEFGQLMDLPTVFPVVREIIGADIELASGGELDHKAGPSPAHIGWHNDFQWMTNVPYPRQNFWIRCTYFIGDVTSEMGPFTLLPGSHKSEIACPDDWRDAAGQPLEREGSLGITGKAGSCLINNTEIWHTNTPNRTSESRRLIMILYKHAWMKSWQEGYEISPEFAEAQTDEVRRQLCGGNVWHQSANRFPVFHRYPTQGAEASVARLRSEAVD